MDEINNSNQSIKKIALIYHEDLPPYYFYSLAELLNKNNILIKPIHIDDFLDNLSGDQIPSTVIVSAIWKKEIEKINLNTNIFNHMAQDKQLLYITSKAEVPTLNIRRNTNTLITGLPLRIKTLETFINIKLGLESKHSEPFL